MDAPYNCRKCAHYFVDYESYEMPHINWPMCRKLPQRANLKSFPFMVTNCKSFESHLTPVKETLDKAKAGL